MTDKSDDSAPKLASLTYSNHLLQHEILFEIMIGSTKKVKFMSLKVMEFA